MTGQQKKEATKRGASPPPQLTVPSPDAVESLDVETDPLRLTEWISHLPYANPLSTATALYESIYRLNRFPGALNQRQALTGCYQPPFEIIYQAARQASLQKGTPATLKQGDIGRIAIKISIELAYSHKFIINQQLQHDSRRQDPQRLGQAIHAAMQAIAQELMLEYANLIPDSKKAWREFFQLYALAEQYGLTRTAIAGGASIEQLFKQLLLTAIIDPYRLPKGEVWFCYDYLAHWAMKTELHAPARVPDNITGLFLVDLHTTHPPKPPQPNAPLQPGRHRLLHVNPLNLVIHQQRKQLLTDEENSVEGAEALPKAQAVQLLRHMLLAWHVRPTRRSKREEKYGTCLVAYGLSAINHYLERGGFTRDDAPAEEPPDDDTLMLGETASFCRSNRHFQPDTWRIFNKSNGGIGITTTAPFPKEVQIGQLVMLGLDANTDTPQLKTGIIRRMIKRDANTLEIGVQFLPGAVTPAAIRPHFYDKEITADFQHGLLIERGAKTPRALVTPHGMYQPQRELVLDNNGFVQRIIADNLIETTPFFDCFDYHKSRSQPT